MSKKKKVRVELRRNRTKPPRENDLTRQFHSDAEQTEDAQSGERVRAKGDVSRREFFALGSLAALCLILGLYPQPVIDTMKADVRVLSNISDGARARIRNAPYVSKEPYVPPIIPREDPAPRPAPKGPQVNDANPKGAKGKDDKSKNDNKKKDAKAG